MAQLEVARVPSIKELTDLDATAVHFVICSEIDKTIAFLDLFELVSFVWAARNRCSRKSDEEESWSVTRTVSSVFK